MEIRRPLRRRGEPRAPGAHGRAGGDSLPTKGVCWAPNSALAWTADPTGIQLANPWLPQRGSRWPRSDRRSLILLLAIV